MILPFSTKFPNGKPTYFIQKIWNGLIQLNIIGRHIGCGFTAEYFERFNKNWDYLPFMPPKLHTIRKDEHNRWKPGIKIHFDT